MSSDRNSPCPCGSGRKTKKCCSGPAATMTVSTGADWGVVFSRLLDRLAVEVDERLDDDVWDDAVTKYSPAFDTFPPELFDISVLPWLVSAWRPSPFEPTPPGLRADESFVERALRKDRHLSTADRRFLEAWAREPTSWWRVDSVEGPVVTLRDAFRGSIRRIDVRGRDVTPGMIVHARILDIDGQYIPVELAPTMLAPEGLALVPRLREQMRAPDPVDDAWLHSNETLLRLAFLHSAVGRPNPRVEQRLAFACVDLAQADLDAVLGCLTTGLEADVTRAREALDDGVLRWRDVEPETGLPLLDDAWIIRRGDLLELRALDSTDNFALVRRRVDEQLASCDARLLEPQDALRRILASIVPERDAPPERALLRRLVAVEREAWGDVRYASQLREPGIGAGLLLPTPERLELCAHVHATVEGPRFLPGDETPPDWLLGESTADRAMRLAQLSEFERETLQAMRDATAHPFRVIEVLGPRCVRVADAFAPEDVAEPLVAMLPAAIELSVGDQLGAVLMAFDDPSQDASPSRFLLAIGCDKPADTARTAKFIAEGCSLDWLDEAAGENEYLRHFTWRAGEEIYHVAEPEALMDQLARIDETGSEVDDDGDADSPLRVERWQVHRDPSGAIALAVGAVVGEVNMVPTHALLRMHGHELRLSSDDPDALSAWRADLARVGPQVTTLTWLRQERGGHGASSEA